MLKAVKPTHSSAGNEPAGGGAAAPEPAELDPAAIASLRDLDPTGRNQLLQRVCSAFRSSADRLLPQLREARREKNADAVRLVAHTLKSSSASVGGRVLSQLCADVEGRMRRGETTGLPADAEAIEREVARLLRALEQLTGDAPT